MHATDVIYSDLDIKQIESLPITQPHRSVDITITNADREGGSTLPIHQESVQTTEMIYLNLVFYQRLCKNLHCPAQYHLGYRLGIPGGRRTAEPPLSANPDLGQAKPPARPGGNGGCGKKHLAKRPHPRR